MTLQEHNKNIRAALAALPPGALADVASDLAIALVVAISRLKHDGKPKAMEEYFDLITPHIGVGAHILLLEYLLLGNQAAEEIENANNRVKQGAGIN